MEESQSDKSKRIAKNTIYLYIRTFVVMFISLFTSRVILHALGETDFGVYNLVSGVIVFFTFINSAMTSSTQRYLNFEVGQSDPSSITHIFSTSMMIHIFIAVAILVLGETIGLWFVAEKLNIPADKSTAAMWVYQFSILSACINTIRCPYNAAIIAYEKMDFFAKISIVEAVLKLAIAYLIYLTASNRLIIYSALIFLSVLIINIAYRQFCIKNFKTIRFKFRRDKATGKSMLSFSLWSLLGSGAIVASNQGISMMLNIFYNVLVNAALGIAYQVNTVSSTLVSNFQTAFMPQITKSYASGDYEYFHKLIFTTTRYSFLLFYIVSFPIFFNCDTILHFWLGTYPEYTAGLVKVIIISVAFDALSGPLWMSVHAKGNIRNYQIVASLLLLMTLVACYVAIKAGMSPVFAFGSRILLLGVLYLYRVFYLRSQFNVGIRQYLHHALYRILLIIAISVPIAAAIVSVVSNPGIKIVVGLVAVAILSFYIGLTDNERKVIVYKTIAKIKTVRIR